MAERPLIFLAQRQDGLGERLRAVVNAFCLARLTGQEFRFHWPDRLVDNSMHAIASVGEVFAPDFIARHHLPERQLAGFRELDWLQRDDIDLLNPGVENGWIVQQPGLEFFTFRGFTVTPEMVREAFDALGFSPQLASIIARARAAMLPQNSVAIHFRSGDIVYGYYRHTGRYTPKSLCLPEVKACIERVLEQGATPLLFCPDAEMVAYLKGKYRLIHPDDLIAPSDLTNSELGFRDLILMSRCRTLAVAASGFSTLAAWIGQSRAIVATELYAPLMLNQVVFDDLIKRRNERVYPPLQSAFAYWSAVRRDADDLAPARKVEFMARAAALDPENWFYRYKLGVACLGAGDSKRGSTVLWDLTDDHRAKRINLFRAFDRARTLLDSQYRQDLPVLHAAMQSGSAAAAMFTALVEYSENNFPAAEAAINRGLGLRPNSKSLLRLQGFVQRATSAPEEPDPADAMQASDNQG